MQSKPRKQNASKPPLGLNSFLIYGVSGFISFFCFLCGCSGLIGIFLTKGSSNIVRDKLATNATFVSKIGHINSFEFDLPASKKATEEFGGDAIVMQYAVSGSSGKGKLLYSEFATETNCVLMLAGSTEPVELKID